MSCRPTREILASSLFLASQPQRKRARALSYLFEILMLRSFFPVDICRGHAKTPPRQDGNPGQSSRVDMWRSLRGSRQVPRDFAEHRRCPCRSPLTTGPRIQEDTGGDGDGNGDSDGRRRRRRRWRRRRRTSIRGPPWVMSGPRAPRGCGAWPMLLSRRPRHARRAQGGYETVLSLVLRRYHMATGLGRVVGLEEQSCPAGASRPQ